MKNVSAREIAENFYLNLPELTTEHKKMFVQSCILKVEQMNPENEQMKLGLLMNEIAAANNQASVNLFIQLVDKIVEEIKA